MGEVIVAVAIIAIISVAAMPTLVSKLRDSRTSALATTFTGLSQAIAEFKRQTTKYPGSLEHLVVAPTASSPTVLNICGNQYSATENGLWRGPYTNRIILSTGLMVGDATIPVGLRRIAGPPAYLLIDAPAVEQKTADDLESQFDSGTANAGTGTIRSQSTQIAATTTSALIAAAPSGTTNVSYAIPIGPSAC